MARPARAAARLLFCIGILTCAPAGAVPFQVQNVDTVGYRGIHSSIALDSRGIPHISYYGDNRLLYASMHDSTWSREALDENVGFYSSLALDGNDAPHICYYDSVHADVRYATKAPGYWVTELVDSAGSVGQYASIALDPSGRPGIAYFDFTNGDLKVATRQGGAWTVERADTVGSVGFYTSLAYDAAGRACVSYLDLDGGLKFARRTASGWSTVFVDLGQNNGSFSSLALDTLGYARISYANVYARQLRYAEETPLGWFTQAVDGSIDLAGAYSSLELDRAMDPHISYIGFGRTLTYAVRKGNLWSFTAVDSGIGVTHFNSIALDRNGNPMISYYYEVRTRLKFADASIHLIEPRGGEFWTAGSTQNVVWTGVGPVDVYMSQDGGTTYARITAAPEAGHVIPIAVPNWTSGNVRVKIVRDPFPAESESQGTLTVLSGMTTPWWAQPVDEPGFTGFAPSLALTATGSPRISYWDLSNAAVRYAERASGAWATQTVGSGLGARTQTSTAVAPWGTPSVAYFDNVGNRLMWAPRLETGWAPEIAVPLLGPGEHLSMALDRFGSPRVAYFERVPGRLMLAAQFGISWGTDVVEVGDSVGLWNALALDTLGHPYVSYYSAKNGDLRFASKPGSSWLVETVDAVGNVGANTGLALDPEQNPHVSYVDVTNRFLKYGVKRGGSWSIETVDASGRVGGETSIAVDAQGVPFIAYHDAVRRRLMVARRTAGFWTLEVVPPVTGAGTSSSLALGPDGTPRVAYLADVTSDLRYASYGIEIDDVPPGRWPVGAHRTARWNGNGPVTVSLSHDAGLTFEVLAAGITTGSYAFQVPGPETASAVLRVDRTIPASFSETDTFAIRAGVDLLTFRADQTPFGTGADVTWQTDPAVPDISGYRLERALGGGAYATFLSFTSAASVHDAAATLGTKYRLTAVAGGGAEYPLGEAVFQSRKPLAAGPLPYRGGALVISFAVSAGPGARSEVRLYDVRGRLVRTIARGAYPTGFQSVAWDGTDEKGRNVGSGLYFLKSVSGGHKTTLKISVLR